MNDVTLSDDFVWGDPPPVRGPGRPSIYREVLERLQERPGRSARIRIVKARSSSQTVSYLRATYGGKYKFVSAPMPEDPNQAGIWGTYVGD